MFNGLKLTFTFSGYNSRNKVSNCEITDKEKHLGNIPFLCLKMPDMVSSQKGCTSIASWWTLQSFGVVPYAGKYDASSLYFKAFSKRKCIFAKMSVL